MVFDPKASDPDPNEPSRGESSESASEGTAGETARGKRHLGKDAGEADVEARVEAGVGEDVGGKEGGGIDVGELSVEALCGRLAMSTPTPGAGSGAAVVAALGVSLVSMAFRRSSSEGASPVPAYMAGRADELDILQRELLRLADADAEAYEGFLAARRLDASSDAARAKRSAELERSARAAIEVPFEILEAALSGLRLAAVGAPDQHPNLVCETETGALSLWSAVEACARVVRENLPIAELESAAFADEHARALPALIEESGRLLAEVRDATSPRTGSSGDASSGASSTD